MSTQSDVRKALDTAGSVVGAAAAVLPEPEATVARILDAALTSAGALIDSGQTPEQVIAAMHRAKRIDTSVEDAAVDALVAAKPPA